MAQLGFRTLNEMVGRTDKLEAPELLSIGKPKVWTSPTSSTNPRWGQRWGAIARSRRSMVWKMRSIIRCFLTWPPRPWNAVKSQSHPAHSQYQSCRRHHSWQRGDAQVWSCGAAGRHHPLALQRLRWTELWGLCTTGRHLELEGDANDYFGKGCLGGSSSSIRRKARPLSRKTILLWATWHFMGLPTVKPTFVAWLANGSVSGTVGAGRGRSRGRPWLRVHDWVAESSCSVQTGRNLLPACQAALRMYLTRPQRFSQHCNPETVTLEHLDDPDEIRQVKA